MLPIDVPVQASTALQICQQSRHLKCMLQDRITAGASYVVPSNLALPHVTIRPPFPEAADGPRVDHWVFVLQNEVRPCIILQPANWRYLLCALKITLLLL